MYGPEVGWQHDMTLLRNSRLIKASTDILVTYGRQFYIYDDGVYVLRPWLQIPFDRATASTEQAVYNTSMSDVKVSVEWNCKDLKQI